MGKLFMTVLLSSVIKNIVYKISTGNWSMDCEEDTRGQVSHI